MPALDATIANPDPDTNPDVDPIDLVASHLDAIWETTVEHELPLAVVSGMLSTFHTRVNMACIQLENETLAAALKDERKQHANETFK